MKLKRVTLDGSHLTIDDVYKIVTDNTVTVYLAPSVAISTRKAEQFIQKSLDNKIIYGVNTGFGPMASHIIRRDEVVQLQVNLIRSHASGMGDPIALEYVLASMIVRLNTLSKGYSGVSYDLLKRLELFINKRIIPVIPEHGAVGTSGDLVQLAHIALALISEGEVWYKGKRHATESILHALHIGRYDLKAKEGLALINGTSVMTGIAALFAVHAERLLSLSVQVGSLALELVHGFNDGISEKLHGLRPHQGQVVVASAMRSILSSSKLLRPRTLLQETFTVTEETREEIPEDVQEVYSLRCIPQVLGPVYDTLQKAKKEIYIEMNSVTDNPIVDWPNRAFLHGGNFHGDYIATTVDHLKMTLVKLTLLNERRINFFLNARLNRRFPAFMNLKVPGLMLGLQGLQFVATSTAAQNQTFAYPHSIHSIPTNGDNQDIVSMGTDAALIAMKVVQNAYIVLAIELITLAQGVDFAKEKKSLSQTTRALYDATRKIVPVIINDRVLVKELQQIETFVKTSPLVNLEWGERTKEKITIYGPQSF